MNFLEAARELLDGQKVRQLAWKPEAYIFYRDGRLYYRNGTYYPQPLYDFESWELYIEMGI